MVGLVPPALIPLRAAFALPTVQADVELLTQTELFGYNVRYVCHFPPAFFPFALQYERQLFRLISSPVQTELLG